MIEQAIRARASLGSAAASSSKCCCLGLSLLTWLLGPTRITAAASVDAEETSRGPNGATKHMTAATPAGTSRVWNVALCRMDILPARVENRCPRGFIRSVAPKPIVEIVLRVHRSCTDLAAHIESDNADRLSGGCGVAAYDAHERRF